MNARYRLTGEVSSNEGRTAGLHLLVPSYDEPTCDDGWEARLPALAYDEVVARHPILRAVDDALLDACREARKLEVDYCVVRADLLPDCNKARDVAEPAFVRGLAEALNIYGFITEFYDPRLHGAIISSEAQYIEVAVRQAGYDFDLLGGFLPGSTYFVFTSNRIDRQSAGVAVARLIAGGTLGYQTRRSPSFVVSRMTSSSCRKNAISIYDWCDLNLLGTALVALRAEPECFVRAMYPDQRCWLTVMRGRRPCSGSPGSPSGKLGDA